MPRVRQVGWPLENRFPGRKETASHSEPERTASVAWDAGHIPKFGGLSILRGRWICPDRSPRDHVTVWHPVPITASHRAQLMFDQNRKVAAWSDCDLNTREPSIELGLEHGRKVFSRTDGRFLRFGDKGIPSSVTLIERERTISIPCEQ